MESADRSCAQSTGIIENLHTSIGGIDMHLQVMVMEHAAYDVLLGLPFFTHLGADTRFYRNGEQHLTITDPNTNKCITIPTQQRDRRRHLEPMNYLSAHYHIRQPGHDQVVSQSLPAASHPLHPLMHTVSPSFPFSSHPPRPSLYTIYFAFVSSPSLLAHAVYSFGSNLCTPVISCTFASSLSSCSDVRFSPSCRLF